MIMTIKARLLIARINLTALVTFPITESTTEITGAEMTMHGVRVATDQVFSDRVDETMIASVTIIEVIKIEAILHLTNFAIIQLCSVRTRETVIELAMTIKMILAEIILYPIKAAIVRLRRARIDRAVMALAGSAEIICEIAVTPRQYLVITAPLQTTEAFGKGASHSLALLVIAFCNLASAIMLLKISEPERHDLISQSVKE